MRDRDLMQKGALRIQYELLVPVSEQSELALLSTKYKVQGT